MTHFLLYLSTLFRFLAKCWIVLLIIATLGAEFLANDKPIFCYDNNIFENVIFFKKHTSHLHCIWPLVKHQLEVRGNDFPHLLGTDYLGRDILACLIYGARYSLIIGCLSILLAISLGVVLGIVAGYFYQRPVILGLKTSITWILGGFCIYYYGYFIQPSYQNGFSFMNLLVGLGVFGGILLLLSSISRLTSSTLAKHSFTLSIDNFILRVIELLESIPVLLIIIVIIGWISAGNIGGQISSGTSIRTIILTIGLLSWTGFARIVRGEIIKNMQRPYIEANYALGFSPLRILFLHILPNSLSTIKVLGIIGIGKAIMAEATLSFLGMGGANFISWGKMLHIQSSETLYMSTTLSIIMPGIVIFFTIFSFYILGNNHRKYVTLYK